MTGPSIERRIGWSLLALCPGLIALALRAPGASGALSLGATLAATAIVAVLASFMPGQRGTGWRIRAGMLLPALIAWAWVACIAPAQAVAAVLAAAIAAALHAVFGGVGQSPFHSAAAGTAAVLVFTPGSGFLAPDAIASLALTTGAVLMLVRGLLAPASLLGWLAGLVVGAMLAGRGGLVPSEALSPALALVGGFVLADGASAGMRSTSRAACGIAAGLLAATLPGPAALPCAVLLANLLVPAIERALPPRLHA